MKHKLFMVAVVAALAAGCGVSPASPVEGRIQRVETGLLESWGDPPGDRMTLVDRMRHYNVPGVSIAVINDFEIEWAKGYGVLEAGKDELVTPDTLFQAGSPGKSVVATATMHFVETGLLDLDENVNDKLMSWKVPDNDFTLQEKVTLRRLLSHTAGVSGGGYGSHGGGFLGYTEGEEIPTLQQILNGEPPANSVPVRVEAVPGTQYRYSGGGYVIVQQLLIDVLSKPFSKIIQETVFDPLGMTSSTFELPLPEALEARAAAGHRPDGRPIPGGWYTLPSMGAGGSFWTTPSDLARFAIEIMRARAGRSDRVVSQETVDLMLSFASDAYGMGFELSDEGGDRFYFFHYGANEGFQSLFAAYPERGQGFAIMTNSDSGGMLAGEIARSISVEYGLVQNDTILYVSILLAAAVVIVGLFLYRRKRDERRRRASSGRA